jgi:hypothetical protein
MAPGASVTTDLMKLIVGHVPGFSATLAAFEATLIVGGRGSLWCRWLDETGRAERQVARHEFGLTSEAFLAIHASLAKLPPGALGRDLTDCAERVIRSVDGDSVIERRRRITLPGDSSDERQFDRIWAELCRHVVPALIGGGVPEPIVQMVTRPVA